MISSGVRVSAARLAWRGELRDELVRLRLEPPDREDDLRLPARVPVVLRVLADRGDEEREDGGVDEGEAGPQRQRRHVDLSVSI